MDIKVEGCISPEKGKVRNSFITGTIVECLHVEQLILGGQVSRIGILGRWVADQVKYFHWIPLGHQLNTVVKLGLALSNTLETEL